MLIMIKWKLNVILFILLKGNSYIVCIRIFLLWTYRYRGFKIFERYRQPTLEKYAAVTILRGCKLWSNNIRVRINYYCWSLWGVEGLGLPVFNQLCWIAALTASSVAHLFKSGYLLCYWPGYLRLPRIFIAFGPGFDPGLTRLLMQGRKSLPST